MPVTHVEDVDQFDKIIASNKYVIVDFFADWCSPCKAMAPLFESLSDKYSDIVFVKVNTEKVEGLSQRYEISSIPTVFAFYEGEKVLNFVGFDAQRLEQTLVQLHDYDKLDLVEFHGLKVLAAEAQLLQDIEKSTSKQFVVENNPSDLKCMIEGFHVIALEITNIPELALAEQLATLPVLQYIALTKMNYTEYPEVLSKLSSLQILDLSNNQLSALPSSVAQLENLRAISLAYNEFTLIPEVLFQMPQLATLSLFGNKMTTVPDKLTTFQDLEMLDVGRNNLGHFPAIIFQLTNLAVLGLAEVGIPVIPDEISQLKNLEHINLAGNKLTALPATMSSLQHLEQLELQSNAFEVFPPVLLELPALKLLAIHENKLTSLPDNIDKMQELRLLELSQNKLTSLPKALGTLPIEGINVENNPLDEQSLKMVTEIENRQKQAFYDRIHSMMGHEDNCDCDHTPDGDCNCGQDPADDCNIDQSHDDDCDCNHHH